MAIQPRGSPDPVKINLTWNLSGPSVRTPGISLIKPQQRLYMCAWMDGFVRSGLSIAHDGLKLTLDDRLTSDPELMF